MEEQATDFLIGGILGLFAWFFGGIDGFLSVLITLIIIDWIFGTLNGYINHSLSWKEFRIVWARKLGELSYVGIMHLLDKYMFGDTATFRTAVTLFYIVVEGKSIIGHTTKLGLPVPKFIETRLLEIEEKLNTDEKLTRGESIKKAIDSDVFKKSENKNDKINKKNIDSVYTRIFDGD